MRRLPTSLNALTAREREVLGLIGQGLSLPEIARRLHRSPKTIESHRLTLGRKLKASNRVELARIAITAGLAPLDHASRSDEQRIGALRRDLSEHATAWTAMRELDAALASHTGHCYLRKLLVRLCEVLQVRAAVLSETTGPAEPPCRDILACTGGEGEIFEFERVPLAQTPCEHVIEEGFFRQDSNVRARFPDNPLLEQLEAQGFIGVRLNSTHRWAIGVLALVNDGPFDERMQPEVILRICAARAAAELERARMDEKLLESNEQLDRRVQQRTQQLQQLNHQLEQRLTQVRQTQRQLEFSEQRFRTLIETMNEGVGVMDAHGTITYVNQRFAEMLGRTPDDLIGASPTEFIADTRQAAWFSAREFDRRRGTLEAYRIKLRRSDGSVFTAHISPRSLYDEQGCYVGSFGVLSEVSNEPPSDAPALANNPERPTRNDA